MKSVKKILYFVAIICCFSMISCSSRNDSVVSSNGSNLELTRSVDDTDGIFRVYYPEHWFAVIEEHSYGDYVYVSNVRYDFSNFAREWDQIRDEKGIQFEIQEVSDEEYDAMSVDRGDSASDVAEEYQEYMLEKSDIWQNVSSVSISQMGSYKVFTISALKDIPWTDPTIWVETTRNFFELSPGHVINVSIMVSDTDKLSNHHNEIEAIISHIE